MLSDILKATCMIKFFFELKFNNDRGNVFRLNIIEKQSKLHCFPYNTEMYGFTIQDST